MSLPAAPHPPPLHLGSCDQTLLADYQTGSSGDLRRFVWPGHTANCIERKKVKGDTSVKTMSHRRLAVTCQTDLVPGTVSEWPEDLLPHSTNIRATDERQVTKIK